MPYNNIYNVVCCSWVFGELLCHLQAYVAAILFIVSIYSLMWMSVDYYMAIRKGGSCICYIIYKQTSTLVINKRSAKVNSFQILAKDLT